MSSLIVGPQPYHKSFFESVSSGWGPFSFLYRKEERKEKKDLAKVALQEKAVTFEHQRVLEHDARQAAAMEELRGRIMKTLSEVEAVAIKSAKLMEETRKLAENPILSGTGVRDEVAQQAADMDAAVVRIQAGTVADVASFDTNALAVSYADAQAALIAMRAIQTRVAGLKDRVLGEIEAVKREEREAQKRAEEAARQRREAERQARLEADRREMRRLEAERAKEQRRRDWEAKRLRELNAEIIRERRALQGIRLRAINLKAARAR